MRIGLPTSVTDRNPINNLPADTQILKGRTTWRNLPFIFQILRDFDYLTRFFGLDYLRRRTPRLRKRPLAGAAASDGWGL